MTKWRFVGQVLVLCVLGVIGCSLCDSAGRTSKKLQDLVDQAAALVQSKGEQAFPELRVRGSKWFHDDTYVFVVREDGVELVNPAFPQFEGKNWADIEGGKYKSHIDTIFKELADRDAVSLTVDWPKPGSGELRRKVCYFRKVTLGGKVLAVGSGVYAQ